MGGGGPSVHHPWGLTNPGIPDAHPRHPQGMIIPCVSILGSQALESCVTAWRGGRREWEPPSPVSARQSQWPLASHAPRSTASPCRMVLALPLKLLGRCARPQGFEWLGTPGKPGSYSHGFQT